MTEEDREEKEKPSTMRRAVLNKDMNIMKDRKERMVTVRGRGHLSGHDLKLSFLFPKRV